MSNEKSDLSKITLHDFAKDYMVVRGENGSFRKLDDYTLDQIKDISDKIEKGYELLYIKGRGGVTMKWVNVKKKEDNETKNS